MLLTRASLLLPSGPRLAKVGSWGTPYPPVPLHFSLITEKHVGKSGHVLALQWVWASILGM